MKNDRGGAPPLSRGRGTGASPSSSVPRAAPPTTRRSSSTTTRSPSNGPRSKPASSSSSSSVPNEWIVRQQELQSEHRCDYAVILYCKDPSSPAGARPKYLVDDVIPVKLSHQIFIQLSFAILRDRLMNYGTSAPAPSPSEYDRRMRPTVPERRGTQGGGGGGRGGTRATASVEVSKEQDALALFTFLQRFVSQFAAAKKSSLGLPANAKLFPNIAQQLRFQLLVEHGVDVQALMKKMQEDAVQGGHDFEASQSEYWSATMCPNEVSEEEFMVQVSKPSGMAQECTIC